MTPVEVMLGFRPIRKFTRGQPKTFDQSEKHIMKEKKPKRKNREDRKARREDKTRQKKKGKETIYILGESALNKRKAKCRDYWLRNDEEKIEGDNSVNRGEEGFGGML